jgi:phospholipase/lecithinase/hemolysin
MRATRRSLCFIAVVVCLFFPALGAFAQTYTSIVVFGDSLSDTGNDAYLSQAKYGIRIPGPIADYTDGRFTDGITTSPASTKYSGVWIEQLAAMLPSKPLILDSLNGGTNYAYGFAFTGQGTSNLVLTTSPITLSITIDNIGLQISNYLATHPKIDNQTLFVVWGGANDVLNATTASDIVTAATNQALNIYQLIKAGATQFIVPNLPPLGATPRLNASPSTSVPYNEASAYFNKNLSEALTILETDTAAKHPSIFQLDVYTLFSQIIAAPATYGLTNVTNSSQQQPVNPDTYLFWDDLHPTTHGHNILASAAAQLIGASECSLVELKPASCATVAATH